MQRSIFTALGVCYGEALVCARQSWTLGLLVIGFQARSKMPVCSGHYVS